MNLNTENIKKIHNFFINNNLSISVAESCTAGVLSHILTTLSNSSLYFKGGIIAYNNLIKSTILSIDIKKISKYSAVSKEIVLDMAINCQNIFDSDISISTSGYIDPISDCFCYICIYSKKFFIIKKIILNKKTRSQNKIDVVKEICNTLINNFNNLIK